MPALTNQLRVEAEAFMMHATGTGTVGMAKDFSPSGSQTLDSIELLRRAGGIPRDISSIIQQNLYGLTTIGVVSACHLC